MAGTELGFRNPLVSPLSMKNPSKIYIKNPTDQLIFMRFGTYILNSSTSETGRTIIPPKMYMHE